MHRNTDEQVVWQRFAARQVRNTVGGVDAGDEVLR